MTMRAPVFITLAAAGWRGGCGVSAADLDITGPTARVRFLSEADAEYAVLEGGDGWLNTTARMAALDYIAGETSLLDIARRLSSLDALNTTLQATIASLQATVASQQATIASQQATIDALATSCTAPTTSPPQPAATGSALSPGSFYFIGGTYLPSTYPTQDVARWDVQTGSWHTDEVPGMSHYRQKAAAVVHDGFLYVIGGTGLADSGEAISADVYQWNNLGCPAPDGNTTRVLVDNAAFAIRCAGDAAAPLTSVERYPLAGGSWSPVASLPTAMAYSFAASLGAHIYVSDGFSLIKYVPGSDTWVQCTPPSINHGRPAQNSEVGDLVALSGRLYLVGGYFGFVNSNYQHDNFQGSAYDPDSDTWSLISPFPFDSGRNNVVGRERFGMVAVGNSSFYTIAGDECPYTCPPCCSSVSYVERYDVAAQTWSSRASAPQAFTGMDRKARSVGDMIYVFPDYVPSRTSSRSTWGADEIFAYDTSTNVWSVSSSLPVQLRYTSMVYIS